MKTKKITALALALAMTGGTLTTAMLGIGGIARPVTADAYYHVYYDDLFFYAVYDDENGDLYAEVGGRAEGNTAAELVIPESIYDVPVKGIGFNAFREDEYLTSITFPSTLEFIDDCAFEGVQGLTFVYIPDGTKAIHRDAFYKCANIEKVRFPESIDTLEYRAFSECDSLNYVMVPPNVTNFDTGVFSDNDLLDWVTFTGSPESIPNSTFAMCKNLLTVEMPDSVKRIGDCAFIGCDKITFFEFPKYLEEIGEGAFEGVKFKEIDLPDTVRIIGKSAFQFSNAEKITIPEGVEYIGKEAFDDHKAEEIVIPSTVKECCRKAFRSLKLKKIVLPENMTYIPDGIAEDCQNLEEIVLPKAPKVIGKYAFASCSKLDFADYKFPDTIEEISEYAFGYNNYITEVVLPKNVRKINGTAFWCDNLKKFTFSPAIEEFSGNFIKSKSLESVELPANCKNFKEYEGIIYSPDMKTLVYCPSYIGGKVVVPEGVEKLSTYAINDNTNITSLSLPSTLRVLGDYAILSYTALREILFYSRECDFNDNEYSIYHGMIYPGAYRAEEAVVYGYKDSDIEKYCEKFEKKFELLENYKEPAAPVTTTTTAPVATTTTAAPTTTTTAPATTTAAPYTTKAISTKTPAKTTIPASTTTAIPYTTKAISTKTPAKTTVPVTTASAAPAASGTTPAGIGYEIKGGSAVIVDCGSNAQRVVVPAEIGGKPVEAIAENAFDNCDDLKTLSLPATVKKIDGGAINNCDGITSIILPKGISEIAAGAFKDCDKLTEVLIPEGVTNIGAFFDSCPEVKEITVCSPNCTFDKDCLAGCAENAVIRGLAGSDTEKNALAAGLKFVPVEVIPEVGNVNCDTFISASDSSDVLVTYSKVSTGNDSDLTIEQRRAADVDGDGLIDASDASFILQYYSYVSTGGKCDGFEDWFENFRDK